MIEYGTEVTGFGTTRLLFRTDFLKLNKLKLKRRAKYNRREDNRRADKEHNIIEQNRIERADRTVTLLNDSN